MIITIDGPAGTGKTTVAKRVADALHFVYFDTGAMYRAVTWMLLERHIALNDEESIALYLKNFDFTIRRDHPLIHYFVGDLDVTEHIRSTEVTAHVSEVAALPVVRKTLWKLQHQFAEQDAVFEGRDMGTVVFPDAEVKIFLTGRPEVRARRRLKELIEKRPKEGEVFDEEMMVQELMRRDDYDSNRTLAPLKCPDDAYIIDTSDLTLDEVVKSILKYKTSKQL